MLRRILCLLGMHQPILVKRVSYTANEGMITEHDYIHHCARRGCPWEARG